VIPMQGVTYYQLNSSTTSLPSADGATADYIDGFYGVDGTLEYLIWRVNLTLGGTSAVTTDVSSLVSKFKLVIDGEILYDWVSGFAPAASTLIPGRFGYFINQIGGRALQTPMATDGTSVDMYIAIPVGIVLQGTPRFEITYAFYDANLTLGTSATVASGSSTFWARFNPNTQRATRVVSATSFTHGANLTEQVVVRVPAMPGGYVLDAVSIQNASDDDDGFGDDGIRALALSQFSMPISLQRWANNELGNGIMTINPTSGGAAATAGNGVVAQTYHTDCPGILNVPLYGLRAGDLTMMVSNGGDGDTRLYHPVLTAPMQGVQASAPVQTAAVVGNTQKSILARTESDN
jgi:hypothetical protein